jgi:uncharacterized protein YjbJ (UPF0337 family)
MLAVGMPVSGISCPTPETRSTDMGSKMDDAKGRVKEAAGVISGDERLEREGKLDQAGGAVKDVAERATDAVGDAVDAVKDKLTKDSVAGSDSSRS